MFEACRAYTFVCFLSLPVPTMAMHNCTTRMFHAQHVALVDRVAAVPLMKRERNSRSRHVMSMLNAMTHAIGNPELLPRDAPLTINASLNNIMCASWRIR